MDFVNGKDPALCGGLNTSCTVLILHDGVFQQMQMQDVLNYLAGAQVTTDTTLRQEGMAADSAAVREYVDGKWTPVTVSLTVAGWSNNQQTVTVANVTADSAATSVIVAPDPAADNYAAYNNSGVRCTAQGAGTLTFSCDSVPSTALTVNVLVRRGSYDL